MPNCKLCGRHVITGGVIHSLCMELWADKLIGLICDEYCKVPELGDPKMCDTCQIEKMLEEVLD